MLDGVGFHTSPTVNSEREDAGCSVFVCQLDHTVVNAFPTIQSQWTSISVRCSTPLTVKGVVWLSHSKCFISKNIIAPLFENSLKNKKERKMCERWCIWFTAKFKQRAHMISVGPGDMEQCLYNRESVFKHIWNIMSEEPSQPSKCQQEWCRRVCRLQKWCIWWCLQDDKLLNTMSLKDRPVLESHI